MPRRYLSVFALAFGLTVTLPSHAGDWPHLLGPHGNGTAEAADAFSASDDVGLREVWRRPLGSGYASMITVGDRIFTSYTDGDDDVAVALELSTGEEIWRYRLSEAWRGYDGSDDGSIASPTVDDGVAYFLTPAGVVHAVDADTGAGIWTLDLVERFDGAMPFYGFAASPLVDGPRLVLQAGGEEANNLVAVDKTTGKTIWTSHHATGHTYASPLAMTFDGDRQIVALAGNRLIGVAPETGELLWSVDSAERHPDRLMAISQNRVFLPLETEGGVMIRVRRSGDGWTADELWREPRIANSHGMPVEYDGVLYAFSGAILTALDVDSGEMLWRGRVYDGSVIEAGGRLVLLSRRSGTLQVLDPNRDDFRSLAEVQVFEAGRPSITPPSFGGGMILVRNLQEAVAYAPAAGGVQTAARATEGGSDGPLRVAWRATLETDLGPSGIGRPALTDDVIYLTVAAGDDESLLALDRETGEEAWRADNGTLVPGAGRGAVGTPIVSGKRVFAVGNDCVLRSFDRQDGQVAWSVDLRETYQARDRRRGCETSPAVANGIVLAQTAAEDGPTLVALDADTGKLVWTSTEGELGVYGTPRVATVGGEPQVLLHTFTTGDPRQSVVHGLRLSDGATLWSYRSPGGTWSFRPIVPISADRLVVEGWSGVAVVQVKRDGETWTADELWGGGQMVSPIEIGDQLCGSRQGQLTCVDVASGDETARQDTANVRLASLGDELLVQSFGGGWVSLMTPNGNTFTEAGRMEVFNIGASSETQPVVDGGTAYLRNHEEIVAIELGD